MCDKTHARVCRDSPVSCCITHRRRYQYLCAGVGAHIVHINTSVNGSSLACTTSHAHDTHMAHTWHTRKDSRDAGGVQKESRPVTPRQLPLHVFSCGRATGCRKRSQGARGVTITRRGVAFVSRGVPTQELPTYNRRNSNFQLTFHSAPLESVIPSAHTHIEQCDRLNKTLRMEPFFIPSIPSSSPGNASPAPAFACVCVSPGLLCARVSVFACVFTCVRACVRMRALMRTENRDSVQTNNQGLHVRIA